MKELQKEDLIKRYPELKAEVTSILKWWRGKSKNFEIPNTGARVNAETQWAYHGGVYDRLSWHKSSVTKESDEEMRKHNRKLLELLKNEFGWKEEDERFYPNPEDIY